MVQLHCTSLMQPHLVFSISAFRSYTVARSTKKTMATAGFGHSTIETTSVYSAKFMVFQTVLVNILNF